MAEQARIRVGKARAACVQRDSDSCAPLLALRRRSTTIQARRVALAVALAFGGSAGTLPGVVGAQEQLRPIVVESLRSETEIGDTSAPVSQRDRDTLEREQPRDLGEMLREIPGATVSGGPRATAIQPVIRGLGGERVVIRLDGARQNFSSGHRGRVFVDPFLIDRVEVLRGPASVLFGSGALGGVVSFRTLDAEGFLKPGERVGARITGGYQSQGDFGLGAVSAAAANTAGTGGVLASFLTRQSNDLESGGGETLPFTGDDIRSGLLRGHFRPAPGHKLTLGAQAFRDDHTLPSAANTAALTNIVDRTTDSRVLTARYRWEAPENDWIDLDVSAYRTEIALDERRQTDGRRDETDQQTTGFDLANTSRFMLGPTDHRLTAGVELYRDSQEGFRNGAPRPQFPDARQSVTSAFVVDSIGFGERFELAPGVRIDRFRQSAEGQDSRSENETSAQLTATFHASDALSAYASYSEAFRAPSLTDLYVGGLHFPGNFFEPNPDLRPEKAKNVEIGLNFDQRNMWAADDRLRVGFNVYRNRVEDFIEQQVVFDSFFPTPVGRTFSENVLDARLQGQELEVDYQHPAFFVRATASRLRGTNRDEGTPLGGIPADALTLSGGRYFAVRDWLLGARVTHARDQDRVPEGGTPTPGYTLLDAFVTWQPSRFQRRLRVDFGVDNVTDRDYRPHLQVLPEPGRNYKIQASYRF